MYSVLLWLIIKQIDKACSRSRGAQPNVPSWFQRVINLIFIVSLPWRFVETIQRERTRPIGHVWSPTVPSQLAACASPAEPQLSWQRAGAGRPVTSQLWLVCGSQMWFIGRDMNHGSILEPDALRGTCSLSLIIWVKPEHRRSGDRGSEFDQWTQRLVNTADDADKSKLLLVSLVPLWVFSVWGATFKIFRPIVFNFVLWRCPAFYIS